MDTKMPPEGRPEHASRWELLKELDRLTDRPLVYLSFVWLVLIAADFVLPPNRAREAAAAFIWALFIVDFAVEFWIAPDKRAYLRGNWITAAALVLPAFRMFRAFRSLRVLRTARVARSVRFLRLLTSLNRGIGALGETFARRGVGYVVLLSAIVTFSGAAAMLRFEGAAQAQPGAPTAGFQNYGDALWWTAMIMTTMGSEAWPKTAEGRIFGWLLSLYAFSVFGYITATLASHFIGIDSKKRDPQAEVPLE